MDDDSNAHEVQRIFSGAPWEKRVGYCRAIRVGNQIFVSGTAPVGDDGEVFAPGDAYHQARRCFEIAAKALERLNCPLAAVVRTRMYVTDISRWVDYGKAHAEIFGEFPPTTTMVEIKALIDPAMLIEVEVDAIVPAIGVRHDILQK